MSLIPTDTPENTPADTPIETPAETPAAETPTADDADTDTVFNDMIPLFKKLNLDEDTARSAVDRLVSGKDIGDLVDDQGLIFGKYKDSVAAQDAFKHLESENGRLRREKAPTAPDAYEYNYAEDNDIQSIVDKDYNFAEDPLVEAMDPVFKELNLTQDQVSSLVKAHVMYESQMQPNKEEEMSKLGADANKITAEVGGFISRNFTEDEQDILHQTASTADGVKLLHKLSKFSQAEKNIPTGEAATVARESSKELYQKAFDVQKKAGSNFEYNSTAKELYEDLMDKAIAAELKGL